MLLERFDPFIAEFDRLTQRTFGTTDGVGLPMDVIRHEDALEVRVDLPGVARDSIEVTLDNHMLTISAERRAAYGDSAQVLFQERFDGAMSRRLRVPDWVDAEAVTADYVDGVLALRLPLAERAKPRRITIGEASDQTAIAS
ncbi:MAG: Hsp20/alpha crystallin family protein [Frankiaceae bacterium]|nr:Hsp20/alpha crystallin family protein [Frankiaceae bacterium]MBV9869740.1 Hsp20/alpha crystallin family protein [Frankiaceae bacterium]